MQSLSRFQIILLSIFAFFIIAGVIVFATLQSDSRGNIPPLVVWGVISEPAFRMVLEDPVWRLNGLTIDYEYKDESRLDRELVEAIAEGRGPDLVIMPQSQLHKEKPKLQTVSYNVLPARDFKDTYIEASEILMGENGLWGFPLVIDPLVLFWNRTNFSSASIIEPPRTWDELILLVPKLAKKDAANNLRSFAIALGEYQNISHAKEILATLVMQNGNPLSRIVGGGDIRITLSDGTQSGDEALQFFTSFADPVKNNYTWNRAQKNAELAFTESTLSMYIGFGSEIEMIARRNPNLNFDVASIPQLKDMPRATFGNLIIAAIPRGAQNPNFSLLAAEVLSSPQIVSIISSYTGLPPARKDLLKSSPDNAYQKILYDSAIIAKVFEDPDNVKSELIFKDLIESVTSGRTSPSEAVSFANQELQVLIRNNDE